MACGLGYAFEQQRSLIVEILDSCDNLEPASKYRETSPSRRELVDLSIAPSNGTWNYSTNENERHEQPGALMIKRGWLFAVLMTAPILCAPQATQAQSGEKPAETFKARLSTVPIDVTMMATVAGSGAASAVLTGRKLSIAGTFQGLRSPATIAQLHLGPKGIRGPAVFDLTITHTASGTIGGSIELSPAQVEDLRNGRFYVQIHSEKAPDGNLWGWLLR